MSFRRLPLEIRLMILETIVQQRYPGWASFASVCKEWQHFIEKRNFCRLKLSVSCLDDFQHLVVRQRDLVQHIFLDIELPIPSIGYLISGGIRRLFCILGTWKTTNGLTLELGAHSLSDSMHWFRNYIASDEEDSTATPKLDYSFHDPLHGWSHGQPVQSPPQLAIRQLFKTPDLSFPVNRVPPQVESVTCLTIRREMRRSLPPLSLGLILSKLPRLENLIFEPWRIWDAEWKGINETQMARVITKQFPQSLKRVSIFEDFSDHLTAAIVNSSRRLWYSPVEMDGNTAHKLAAAFAAKCRDLEHLSVAYMIDAEDFFHGANRFSVWENLQSLALTSKLLRPTASRREIDSLLQKAGTVALRMPKLHTLVIWDGIKGNACAFIFHVNGEGVQITWRSTWEMELSSRVVKVWERVTSQRHSRALRVDKQEIHEVIESHGDAIYHLDLPCQVVSPASLGQIRREARFGVVASSGG
ncbi:hypothetical protein BHE90_006540 [Fusarium euwallaceae]|uniref:DUF6546 domain-containing protein n=1 Tax=Fusarium euwallaceae TaxID=1147111 RepID=A0A430LTC0_9HYPO|nr:hypothetical protein BHE90_006540 [Fusarium euwallaceae]